MFVLLLLVMRAYTNAESCSRDTSHGDSDVGSLLQTNVLGKASKVDSNVSSDELRNSRQKPSGDQCDAGTLPDELLPGCKKYCYSQVKNGKQKWSTLCGWGDCDKCWCCVRPRCEDSCATDLSDNTWETLCKESRCAACTESSITDGPGTCCGGQAPATLNPGCKKYCYNQVQQKKRTWSQICSWSDCSSCGCCEKPTTTTTTTTQFTFKFQCLQDHCQKLHASGRAWVGDLCLKDTCNDCKGCCSQQWNTRDKLSPPAGTAWRGAVVNKGRCYEVPDATAETKALCKKKVTDKSCIKQNKWEDKCIWEHRFPTVQDWRRQFGFPLHMKRVFKGKGWSNWYGDEVDFMKSGGIIFYSIAMKPPQKFTDYNAEEGRALITEFADVIKQAPVMNDGKQAKVLVTVRYEQDHWSNPQNMAKYMGTPAEYRKMFSDFAKVFKEEGLDNVVWSVDYSSYACTEKYHELLAHLYPGDVQIDWLFWNMFQFGTDKKRTFADMFEVAYSNFEKRSGVPQTLPGHGVYTANYNGAANWGLGAWGANYDPNNAHEIEWRNAFIAGLTQAIGSEKYPRFRGHVYFDTDDPNAGSGSQIKEENEEVYMALNSLAIFMRNDNESWCPA